MNNILDLYEDISEKQRENILAETQYKKYSEYNIKSITRDPFAGYPIYIIFKTKEDMVEFKLKYG